MDRRGQGLTLFRSKEGGLGQSRKDLMIIILVVRVEYRVSLYLRLECL